MSKSCPGLLVSTNKNGTVKVWDVKNHTEPEMIFEKQTNLGQIICLEASCDSPYTFAVGGDNKANNLHVYDFSTIREGSFNQILFNLSIIYSTKYYILVAENFKDRATIKSKNLSEENNLMDVTDDLESIALEGQNSQKIMKKKKKPRHRDLYKQIVP